MSDEDFFSEDSYEFEFEEDDQDDDACVDSPDSSSRTDKLLFVRANNFHVPQLN